jgi:hypothetical protein
MDKFEYNVRANEIKELIREEDFRKAAEIADTIDWRRVKSTRMLCMVSDVYKINRRYVDSRDILTYALERNPNGRLIIYYLCELSIELDDIIAALEYYKRFVIVAPHDASHLILLYKIYKLQDATLEERITVLEELKRRDYREKWAYELACLYNMNGDTSRCIEECDEIFLWFGRGKYVTKALQLKQTHVSLPENQLQRLGESAQDVDDYAPYMGETDDYYGETGSEESSDVVFSGFDDGQTRSRVPEIGMKQPERPTDPYSFINTSGRQTDPYGFNVGSPVKEDTRVFTPLGQETETSDDDLMNIQIKTHDVSEYSTINLQREIAEGMRGFLDDEPVTQVIPVEEIQANMEHYVSKVGQDFQPVKPITYSHLAMPPAEIGQGEVYFGDTDEISQQEAARREMARQEAIRQEAMREEAAKQEILRQAAAAQQAAAAPETPPPSRHGEDDTISLLGWGESPYGRRTGGDGFFSYPDGDTGVSPPPVILATDTRRTPSIISDPQALEGLEELTDPDEWEEADWLNTNAAAEEEQPAPARYDPYAPPIAQNYRPSEEEALQYEEYLAHEQVFQQARQAELEQMEEEEITGPPATRSAYTDTGAIRAFSKSSPLDEILSMENDGQISLVVPDEPVVERQITGQLVIDDILTEWERQKREIEEKRRAEVKKKVQEQADTLFSDFSETTKLGLLEKLEEAMLDAAARSGPAVIKVADIGSERNNDVWVEEETENVEYYSEETTEDYAKTAENYFEDEDAEDRFYETTELDVEDIYATADEETAARATPASEPTPAPAPTVKPAPPEPAPTPTPTVESPYVEAAFPEFPLETEIPETAPAPEPVLAEPAPAPEPTPAPAPPVETAPPRPEPAPVPPDVTADTTEINVDEPIPQSAPSPADPVRELTEDEMKRFGHFVKHKKVRRQLVAIIDSISNATEVSHLIVTGEESLANIQVVKGLIKEVKNKVGDIPGRIVKVTGDTLNKKDVSTTLLHVSGGIIIVEQAENLKKETIEALLMAMQKPEEKCLIILEGNRTGIIELISLDARFERAFPQRLDLNALDNQLLVEYAKNFAREQEYNIDEFGILALHTRIAEMQTSDHEVTTAEVEEIVEEAMYYADLKNPKHFFDILTGKRYDEEDMIILREKDFLHK